jgi:hypothetical protein
MKKADRQKLLDLIGQRLLEALEDKPSAKMLDTAVRFLEKLEDEKIPAANPEIQQERAEEIRAKLDRTALPFP